TVSFEFEHFQGKKHLSNTSKFNYSNCFFFSKQLNFIEIVFFFFFTCLFFPSFFPPSFTKKILKFNFPWIVNGDHGRNGRRFMKFVKKKILCSFTTNFQGKIENILND